MNAEPLPVLAVDHLSVTVPDLEQAVTLFVDLLGARELYRREYAAAPGSDEMAVQYGAHPRATFRLAKLGLAGTMLELFEYAAPDQARQQPRNCDVGGVHLGLRVPDIDAAVDRLRADRRIAVLGAVQRLDPPHPLAGRRWIYLRTEWGLQLELVAD